MYGLNVSYSFDPTYFVVGCAYEMRVKQNDFKVGLLSNFSENELIFKVLDDYGNIEDLYFSVDDLRYHDYLICKMRPDYVNGKFEAD